VTVATAPVRVCDAGGWTDTWFAGTGQVCNLAVRPGVRVEVVTRDVDGVSFEVPPTPLLEAAVAEAGASGVHVSVRSMVPPGSSLGTSAAVTVAVLAALGVPRRELATRAHRVETVRLGQQSGVQDQAASAYGGASWIEVQYPSANRGAIAVPAETWRELDERLLTVFLGPHRSSAVHEEVITSLATDPSALEGLRRCAHVAAAALSIGNVHAYADALVANTEAQRALHPALVSDDAQAVIDAAAEAGALGWKVNGAGGDGGTVTIICGDRRPDVDPARVLPLRLSRQGVRVTG
jgi:D-glycero-alpha-D-manno-heptose-7-phosphate kinase